MATTQDAVFSGLVLSPLQSSSVDTLRLDFNFDIPDVAVAGASYTVVLPNELRPKSTAPFSVLDPDGNVVATAVWEGKIARFTFTDFAASHAKVQGKAFVALKWDRAVIGTGPGTYDLDFTGDLVPVTIQASTSGMPELPINTSRDFSKFSGWTRRDEGVIDPVGALGWRIGLPSGPFAGPITVTDTAQPGWTLDCSSLNITKGTTLLGNRSIVDPVPLPASRVVSFSCDPGKFILVLDHIGASEFINVDLTGTVTDQSARTFTNDGGFSTETGTQSSTATATRTQNGGSGEGVPPNSVGNKIFVDQNRDGLQDASDTPLAGVSLTVGRTDGLAATDVNGLPIAAQTSDAQGHFLFEGLAPLPAGVFYQVMVDRNASAAALAGLEPTIAGTGNDSGANSSTWTSVSTVDTSQGNTQDLSLDFGFVTVLTPAPTTPPTTEPTTPPSTEPTAPAPPTSPTSPVIPPATPVPTSPAVTTPIIVPTAPQGPAGTDVPAQDSHASAPADQLAQTGPIALRALVFIGLTALLAGLAALALLRKSRTSKKEVSQ